MKQCQQCINPQPGQRHQAVTKRPTVDTMYKWLDRGIARATDGCKVEPDGRCIHGHNSWMILAGVI